MATHRRQPSVILAPRPHGHTNQAGSSSHFIFVTGPDSDSLPVQLHYRQILYAAPPDPHHCQCPKVSPKPSLPAPTARGRLSDYFSSRNPTRRSFSTIFGTKEGVRALTLSGVHPQTQDSNMCAGSHLRSGGESTPTQMDMSC